MSGTALAIAISPTVTPFVAAANPGPTPPADRDLILWLMADTDVYQDDGFTVPATTDSDPVGGWADQSGNAYPFINASPTAYLDTVGGIACVSFYSDLTPGYLECADFLAPPGYSFAMLIFLTDTPTGTMDILKDIAIGGDKQIEINDTPALNWYNDVSHIPSSFTLTSGLLPASPVIVTGRTGQAQLNINGSLADAESKTPNNNWNGLRLGGQAQLMLNTIYIAELLMWGVELTNDELDEAYAYLATKYAS